MPARVILSPQAPELPDAPRLPRLDVIEGFPEVDAIVVTAKELLETAPDRWSDFRRAQPGAALVVYAEEGDAEPGPLFRVGVDEVVCEGTSVDTLAEAVHAAVKARRDRRRWPRGLAEQRVLVVADSEESAALAVAVREAGFTAELATTLDAALARLREATFDVVLLGDGAPREELLAALFVLAPDLGHLDVGVGEDAWRGLATSLQRTWSVSQGRRLRDAVATVVTAGVPVARLRRLGFRCREASDLDGLGTNEVAVLVVAGTVPRAERARLRHLLPVPLLVLGGEPEPGVEMALPKDASDVDLAAAVSAFVDQAQCTALLRRLQEVDARHLRLIEQMGDAQAELERLETIDHVTETLNRRGLARALQRTLAAARRGGGSVAACLVDCDRFARLEEELGAAAGERLLHVLASRITGALRETDVIGRVGAERFLALLPRTRLAEAARVAERARLAVAAEPLVVEDAVVEVRVRAAVVTVPWETSSLEEVTAAASRALRFDDGSEVRVSAGELGAEMVALLDDLLAGGLSAVAQPIVEIETGRVSGYEMLSRGREGLFDQPEQFLRVARDAGMLTAVDLQCLRTCLRAAQLVPSDKLVHVNLFPSTLLDTPVEELLELMAGIEAPICLELSEEQFVGDPRQLSARLGAIRSAGVRLAIDDLGKGRGTLDSVMLLEPDVVKIDKDLTLGANRDLRKERLLRRLVTLARALGVDVVAEGVETDGDLHLLRELEVDFAQGFYWAAPAPFAGG